MLFKVKDDHQLNTPYLSFAELSFRIVLLYRLRVVPPAYIHIYAWRLQKDEFDPIDYYAKGVATIPGERAQAN